MKNRRPRVEEHQEMGGENSAVNGKRKNMKRLGGGRGAGGLSLAAFANMKSNSNYNPGLIKKQREFYKNAKYVNKYKKTLKRTTPQMQNDSFTADLEEKNGEGSSGKSYNRNNKRINPTSLQILYEKKREEEERAKAAKEAIIKVKREEKEKAEARRKTERQKMFKKTRSGQPVMKYRIEHLLQSIQGSK